MDGHRTYQEMCRDAATAQGLDPITDRLVAEGVPHSVEQTGGFVMVVRIPVAEPAWIGVTAEGTPDAWCVVDYQDETDEGTVLPRAGSYICSPDRAIAAIQEHIALARGVASKRLVNAYVVYGFPDGLGGTYTRRGHGAWGRPEDALREAQSLRDAYHDRHGATAPRRHGATPLAEAPWRRVARYGLPVSYRPPGVSVGIEIHDVHTNERWFVPTTGSPLGPIGPSADDGRTFSHPRPEDETDLEQAKQDNETSTRHDEPPQHRRMNNLRHRVDAVGRADPPDVSL
jgi:hypothetical protein